MAKKFFVVPASQRLICCLKKIIRIHKPRFKNTRLKKNCVTLFLDLILILSLVLFLKAERGLI